MGTVYLAEQVSEHFSMKTALKIIKRGMDSEAILSRFYNERQILAGLVHPNIARLFYGGMTPDGLSYFVMEYIDGKPITTYCDENALTIQERLDAFHKVCDAVAYAHRKHVVHRDIKDSNVLVTAQDEPKLLDFGLAKVLDSEPSNLAHTITIDGFFFMTPEYASPEQIRGQPVTVASDVYSLGVLLYKLLTGQLPYTFENRLQATFMQVICETTPKKPSDVVALQTPRPPEVSRSHPEKTLRNDRNKQRKLKGDLDNIVMKCLRKEPDRRYGNAGELAEDIRRYLDGLPVRATPDSLAYRANRFLRRNKRQLLSALSIIPLIATAIFLMSRVSAWLNPVPEVVFTITPDEPAYLATGQTVSFSGDYRPNGVKIPDLKVQYAVFAGPNRGVSGETATDSHGRFKISYTGSVGPGTDSVRIANIVDKSGKTETSFLRIVHWTPEGVLFGPLGFPIGKPLSKILGGLNCNGQRFSESPIVTHGFVTVQRVARDSLYISIELINGDPNFSYEIEIFEAGEECGSSTLAATGVFLHADAEGNGKAELYLTLPHTPPAPHSVLGDGRESEAFIVVLDWTDSVAGGDRFSTDPLPLPAFVGDSLHTPTDARPIQ
jgi:serine/threonine protein kinase